MQSTSTGGLNQPALGFNEHATGTPPRYYSDLGASMVRLDFQNVTIKRIAELVKLYKGFRIVVLAHSLKDALAVFEQFGSTVEIEYKNEIDLAAMDPMDPAQYVHELRMLAAYGIHPWCGTVSTLEDLTYWNRLVKAGFLDAAQNVAVHLYGDQPEELAARVQWLRKQIGNRPLLISEYGPAVALSPTKLADFMARTIKALPAIACPLVLYRMPEEASRPGWGLVDTVSGKPVAAMGLLQAALATAAS